MNTGLLPYLSSDPTLFVLLLAAIIGAIGLHEYAHALAADLQGDRMPRAMGRLTPNPVKHLDPLGMVFIVLVGFGWGKPVEFRPQALSSERFGAALVALAGPMMNLALALVAALLLGFAGGALPAILVRFLALFLGLNVLLAVFNLIPLPPLDGSRLLTIFLPPKRQNIIFFLDKYGVIILIALLLFGGFTIIWPLVDAVVNFILGVTGADEVIVRTGT